MVSTSSSTAVVGFLDQNYRYKLSYPNYDDAGFIAIYTLAKKPSSTGDGKTVPSLSRSSRQYAIKQG